MIFPELSYKNFPVSITSLDYDIYGFGDDTKLPINLKNPYSSSINSSTLLIYLNNDALTNYILDNNIFCMYFSHGWRNVRILTSPKNGGVYPTLRESSSLYLFCRNKKQIANVKMRA